MLVQVMQRDPEDAGRALSLNVSITVSCIMHQYLNSCTKYDREVNSLSASEPGGHLVGSSAPGMEAVGAYTQRCHRCQSYNGPIRA